MKRLWYEEPAAVVGCVQALIALAIAFGIPLTSTQVGAILAAVAAIGALVTRSQVSSTRALRDLASPTRRRRR